MKKILWRQRGQDETDQCLLVEWFRENRRCCVRGDGEGDGKSTEKRRNCCVLVHSRPRFGLSSGSAGVNQLHPFTQPDLFPSPPPLELVYPTRRGENLSRGGGVNLFTSFIYDFIGLLGMRGQPRGAARPVRVDTGRERCGGGRASSRDTRKERARTVQNALSSSFQETRRTAEAGKQQG